MPSSSSAQARFQTFQNHVEITRKYRGKANVRYAWHGTSRKGLAGIVLHGFGQTSTSKEAYGNGVYLSPEDCSHVRCVKVYPVIYISVSAFNLGNMVQHVRNCVMFPGSSFDEFFVVCKKSVIVALSFW